MFIRAAAPANKGSIFLIWYSLMVKIFAGHAGATINLTLDFIYIAFANI
jgi:hypothetical protein